MSTKSTCLKVIASVLLLSIINILHVEAGPGKLLRGLAMNVMGGGQQAGSSGTQSEGTQHLRTPSNNVIPVLIPFPVSMASHQHPQYQAPPPPPPPQPQVIVTHSEDHGGYSGYSSYPSYPTYPTYQPNVMLTGLGQNMLLGGLGGYANMLGGYFGR